MMKYGEMVNVVHLVEHETTVSIIATESGIEIKKTTADGGLQSVSMGKDRASYLANYIKSLGW